MSHGEWDRICFFVVHEPVPAVPLFDQLSL